MNKKTLTLLLLASITLLSVAGVKVSKLTRTTSFASNDLFIVVTGSTTKVTRHIRAQDLAVGLGPWITNSGSGTGGSATNAQPPSAVLTNLSITGAITNINAITLHSNAVSYASRLGLTNRQAISDISGFFWTLQNEGMLSAFHDAAFLRGGQNTETNITKRETWRGSNAVAWASPVQTANGILTGSGGGGYDFPTEDLSADFTLFFSGQSGAAGQSAGSKMISYTHTLGGTNFGISIGAETPNIKLVVRTNGYAAYANNFFGHLFTDYLMDDYPFPFTAGFGYNVSNNALTNWHNGYLSTNSTGPYQTGLKVISVGGQNDISTTNYVGFWKGTAHGWVLFNRQLASNEVKQLEVALRWLAPGTHNNIAVGDSTSANIYTKQSESWPYQFMIGPGTNTGEHYIAAASGRTAVSMNSLWADTATRRKPQGKVKTATARIWAGINDLYTSQTGQATWEAISNMTWKAGQDGIDVEVGTLYPSVVYDASMKVQWTNLNNQIISNAWMFKKVYRRDLMFAKTNGVMWYDFLHLSTNGLAEVVKDMSLGGQLGWKSVLPYYPVGASAGQVLTSDADGNATWGASSSGGSLATNANQFGASVTLTIASGALLTNLQVRGIDPLGLTVSRALSLNASGDITNGTTTAAELEFVNGVTSAIQTQLNGKQNGQTNSSQFGASTTLTLADRLSVTNLNSYGTGAVFSGHVTVSSNITAGSFIGSGTGVPILKLQTMMAADNSLAFSVRTNFTQLSTNFFEFTSPSAGQGFRLHSVANGQLVWTNALDVEMPTQGLISNVTQITYQMHSGSVVGANSNQTIWLGQTNVSDLLISTNVTFTNFNGITAGRSASFTAFMKVTNAAANVGVNWGNLGGSNPGYAVALWTNANAPMWTTLTNTKTYVLSVTSRGTNLHPTITLWE